MVLKGGKQYKTVGDGEGREFHDYGLGVTLAKNGNATATEQNQNFYCKIR